MKVLVFGSINYDNVYKVDHIVTPGETISSDGCQVFFGGKGLNQAMAVAKAGVRLFFAGMIGTDGEKILQLCDENGIDRSYIAQVEDRTGHAIIQVSKGGENSIILAPGANSRNTREHVEKVLSDFEKGDIIVLQNEINCLSDIVEIAYSKGMTIILNPSPYNEKLKTIDIGKISVLMVNEVEGYQMTGEKEPDRILSRIKELYPKTDVVLTLGSNGSIYQKGNDNFVTKSYPVNVVDTTAAGDTFTGYFVAGLSDDMEPARMMRRASYAAALAVGKEGAIPSIPTIDEVEAGTWD